MRDSKRRSSFRSYDGATSRSSARRRRRRICSYRKTRRGGADTTKEGYRARAAYKRFQGGAPYWSLYNVDESTFARYKVVWRRMDATLRAAVLDSSERALVPQDLLATTSVDSLMEADYLAALLNSTPMRERALAASVPGSKSFGSPGILTVLQPKKFEIENQDDRELAALGAELRIEREQNSNLSARER